MKYEEIVELARYAFENGDARDVFEHVAMQVNIEGEGSGIFYVEIAQRQVCVEPYDYYDRDGIFYTTGETVRKIVYRELGLHEAIEKGEVRYNGNPHKLEMLYKVKPKYKKAAKSAGQENTEETKG